MAFIQLDTDVPHIPPKPTVIGLYGLPGSGKSFLLKQLKTELGEQRFVYYEGSTVISSLVPGGLEAFKQSDNQQKNSIRERAIRQIAEECSTTRRVGVVAGHFLFWDVADGKVAGQPPQSIWTGGDAETYTHIFYLEVPANVVLQRRQNDTARERPTVSVEHLDEWQQSEIKQLRDVCLEHGIHFSTIPPSKVSEVPTLLRDIEEQCNLSRAKYQLDTNLRYLSDKTVSDTVLVFDGDRTLISEDTGALFVKLMLDDGLVSEDPLKAAFTSLGYSYAAFRRVALQTFNDYCQQVAASVSIHPEIVSMLRQAEGRGVAAVVVTCGLRAIWESILQGAGLSDTVKVIGSGRSEDGLIITGEVKGALVSRLRDVHHKYVCAFGDSVLDLPMLKEADRAIVVVGGKTKRSSTMDDALSHAINKEGLHACQVLLPPTAPPRLDTIILPPIDITSAHFIPSITSPMVFSTESAAKLLMTPMRDANISGPALRKAHGEVGWYLAITLLSERIGLEEYPISHVQGNQTVGYRFLDEEKMLIVALMRGGEPLALGISEAMPLAMFIHAKDSGDVQKHHLEGQRTIILVDSVVNTGSTLVTFMRRIRELNETARIMVVAGVVQAKALSRTKLAQFLTMDRNVDQVVALRKSDNKFTGRGGTDTGNRLFNTTRLD
ncbi:hypothetical protein K435DRAFT_826190 [Dendrothele bispora CBS 962.96]|uniref:Phosphoribosyltransferase domain-containing protein n=1 Tax=Dendrothele bispora (strain CBS 962.96) TaxID=1314807 RepID=A0A4S8MSB7_DENBC|nr:hypothetical protein K435DRAFT_826190 [Dendrothele bispora CBS 962.96]